MGKYNRNKTKRFHLVINVKFLRKKILSILFLRFLLHSLLSQGGIYLLTLMDNYSAGFSLLLVAMLECIVIAWVYCKYLKTLTYINSTFQWFWFRCLFSVISHVGGKPAALPKAIMTFGINDKEIYHQNLTIFIHYKFEID